MSAALERFLRYVVIDTTSRHDTGEAPSTPCQWDLARLLEKEMIQMGLADVKVDPARQPCARRDARHRLYRPPGYGGTRQGCKAAGNRPL